MAKIGSVLAERKMFGAHFIYDDMDYCELVALEEQQVDNLLAKFGIEPDDTLCPRQNKLAAKGGTVAASLQVVESAKSIFDGKSRQSSESSLQRHTAGEYSEYK